MKKMNFFKRMLLLTSAIVMSYGLFAQTNFYAWDMTAARPGATDGISCGALNFTEKDITIELWLNIPTSNFTSGVTIASTRHDGVRGFSLDVSSDGRLRGFFRNDGGDMLNGRADYVFPFFFEKADIVDKWVHIAIVFSSTDNIARSYLNGEVYQDLVKSTNPYTPYEIGWIGNFKADGSNVGSMRLGYWYAASAKFQGKIADFRIWSSGRTDAQIKENYNKNLIGTNVENPGLYINYRFYTYERGFINDAYPDVTTNKGWCNPEAGWNNYYSRETLSAYPQNLTVADGNISWNTSSGEWEVTIFKSDDNSEVYIDTINTNSLSLLELSELSGSTNYYAKVRTLNTGVWSGYVTSETFSLVKSGFEKVEKQTSLRVMDGSLIIKAEHPQTLNIYTVSGQMVRRINIISGENTVTNLAKGLYIIDNQKVIIK